MHVVYLREVYIHSDEPWCSSTLCCCCLFGFYVAFNNFSVISRRCLVATGSSVLTFIELPHWSIMPQTLTRYNTQSHYPESVNGLTSPSSTLQVWVPSEEQLVPFLRLWYSQLSLGSNLWLTVPRSGQSSHLSMGWPVLALPCKSECQARSS